MSSDIIKQNWQATSNNSYLEVSLLINNLRNRIWLFGIPSWLFGIGDRTIASLADGYLTIIEIVQLFTAFFFLVAWISLKPETNLMGDETDTEDSQELDIYDYNYEKYIGVGKRILELQQQYNHIISQEYILPFPYICQIYHLLNLKHLETIHSFSLNNLKVVKVSNIEATDDGGMIKFQTILDSPFNALRIWRQPIVEAGLTLHTPYTVELNIPAYGNKRIIVIFNAIPINNNYHKFLIDIYSDLEWPKPILQFVLHFASFLTVFEDMPYLRKLAQRNLDYLVNKNKFKHETMWLFGRFADLYGARLQPSQEMKKIATNS